MSGPNGRLFNKRASIVLIGVRGVGKRSLAVIAAAHLGRRFVSEGLYFEQVTGMSKAQYLQENGNATFYRQSLSILRRMLYENDQDCVIECGMGSLSSQSQRLLQDFSKTHPVVHVVRNFEHVSKLLGIDKHDSDRLMEADLTHRHCSNMEFYNAYDPTCTAEKEVGVEHFNPTCSFVLQNVKADFHNYINFIMDRKMDNNTSPFAISAVALELKPHTYATTVRISEFLNNTIRPEYIESGEDALEIIVDVRTPGLQTQISKYVALVKRAVGIPVIYGVDSEALDPNRPVAEAYLELLEHGLRQAVDYVVVELESPEDVIHSVLSRKGHTKIIGHHHFKDSGEGAWLQPSRIEICEKAKSLGFDLIRLNQDAARREDNHEIRIFRDKTAALGPSCPLVISYNLGEMGRTSLITNRVLTPAARKNSRLGSYDPTGPEITIKQATEALFRCFELDPLKFYVIGQDVLYSRTPYMHISAYQLYGMEHNFTAQNVRNFEDALSLWHEHDFGGSAVSYPYKEKAFDICQCTSPHAAAIGSVNTILPLRGGISSMPFSLERQAMQRNTAGPVTGLYGENSDWSGVFNNIKRKLSPRNDYSPTKSTGLVLGAGGTARSAIYALLQIGCRHICVWNRTLGNALKIAKHFNDWASRERPENPHPVQILSSDSSTWSEGIPLPTMIIACIPTSKPGQEFQLPSSWLESPSGGVVADVG